MPLEQIEPKLKAVDAPPRVTREVLLRRIVEAWLKGQRRDNRTEDHGG